MKKLVVSAMVLVAIPLMAVESDDIREEFQKQFREKNDIMIRLGFDVQNGVDDTQTLANGAGTEGEKRKMGFELSLGAEEKVENLELGVRRLMTFYYHGRTNLYDGHYTAKMNNFGMETTGATYWKLTQYVKPYLGIGFGFNVNQYSDNGQYMNAQNFQLTLNGVAGVSGELVSGLGYYGEYKYRIAPTQTIQATLQDGSQAEVSNNSVDGGVFMAGISYQF